MQDLYCCIISLIQHSFSAKQLVKFWWLEWDIFVVEQAKSCNFALHDNTVTAERKNVVRGLSQLYYLFFNEEIAF